MHWLDFIANISDGHMVCITIVGVLLVSILVCFMVTNARKSIKKMVPYLAAECTILFALAFCIMTRT